MKALAEAPQLLLHCAGIEYQYLMSWDHYDDEWPNIAHQRPYKKLPVLVVDKTHEIAQGIAILSYIEKLAGLNISDPIIAAKSDAVLQSDQELHAPLAPTIHFVVGDDFSSKRDAMTPFLSSRFDDFNRALSSNGRMFFC